MMDLSEVESTPSGVWSPESLEGRAGEAEKYFSESGDSLLEKVIALYNEIVSTDLTIMDTSEALYKEAQRKYDILQEKMPGLRKAFEDFEIACSDLDEQQELHKSLSAFFGEIEAKARRKVGASCNIQTNYSRLYCDVSSSFEGTGRLSADIFSAVMNSPFRIAATLVALAYNAGIAAPLSVLEAIPAKLEKNSQAFQSDGYGLDKEFYKVAVELLPAVSERVSDLDHEDKIADLREVLNCLEVMMKDGVDGVTDAILGNLSARQAKVPQGTSGEFNVSFKRTEHPIFDLVLEYVAGMEKVKSDGCDLVLA